jgi:hypothetical protein
MCDIYPSALFLRSLRLILLVPEHTMRQPYRLAGFAHEIGRWTHSQAASPTQIAAWNS